MKCSFHNERDAEFVCSSCGQPICRECLTVVNGRNVCRTCGYNLSRINMQQYNTVPYKRGDGVSGFLFFIFLCIPGLRHMYLGLMKRGLHFLLAFFGSIALGMLLGDGIGEIVIPVCFIIWFYSAFDSYQSKKMLSKGERVEDVPLFKDYDYEVIKSYFAEKKHFVGITALILGFYLLLKQIARYGWGFRLPNVIIEGINFILRGTVPIVMILFGFYLITKAGKKADVAVETSSEVTNE